MCWKLYAFLVFVISAASLFSTGKSDGCSLNVHDGDTQRKSPLLLRSGINSFDFVLPSHGIANLKRGEGITLSCTDGNRIMVNTALLDTTVDALCVGNNILHVSNYYIGFKDVQCQKYITGGVSKSSQTCGLGNKGTTISIGYSVKSYWINLIKVCYDYNEEIALYTEHTIHGEEIKYASKSTKRPSFRVGGLSRNSGITLAYTQTFQKSTFSNLLGNAKIADQYFNDKNSYLAKGHLSPHADFIYAVFMNTTYYYVNVIPQWQIINTGNWKSVELSIRKVAQRVNDRLTTVTGTHGIISFSNGNTLKEIYLIRGNKLPVPKYIWKIVYSEKLQQGIALVVLNNPFVQTVTNNDLLCKKNICNDYKWGSNNWSTASRGFVHCCDLSEFTQIHAVNGITGVLLGPNL